jgi:tellurite methyltransferase
LAQLRERQLKDQRWFETEPWGAFWEKGYRDPNLSTMGGPSHEIVEIVSALPKGARCLDLGCGEGRNSIYLAGKGFDITAIDRSEAAIAKVNALAARAGVKLTAFVADIANIDIEEDYDLIMAHGVLYYLSNSEWRDLLARAKERTRPAGFNVYTVFIFSDQYPRTPEFRSARYTHSFSPDELKAFYRDWEILRYDSYVKWDQHPGIPLHYHPIEKLVARKAGVPRPEAVLESVPVSSVSMPRDKFDQIPMGMLVDDLLRLCGRPDVIDQITMEGVQVGVAADATVNGYHLNLYFYGATVIYVVNGKVWGRALYTTPMIRVLFRDQATRPPAHI